MAQETTPTQRLVRIAVPAVLVALSLVLGWSVLRNSTPAPKTAPGGVAPPAGAGATPAGKPWSGPGSIPASGPASGVPAAPAKETADAAPATPATPPAAAPTAQGTAPGANAPRFVLKPWPADTTQAFIPLGDIKPAKEGGQYRMKVEFSPIGAGVQRITMADQFIRVGSGAPHELVQDSIEFAYPVYSAGGASTQTITRAMVPFSLLAVRLNGADVLLAASPDGPAWRQVERGKFEALIVDPAGAPVATVTRTFTLAPGSNDLLIEQALENLTAAPLDAAWIQMGPVDLPADSGSYGGDMRRVRLGYLSSPASDPEQQVVTADTRTLVDHASALGPPAWDPVTGAFKFPDKVFWPQDQFAASSMSLAWAATTNRYFAVAVHPVPEKQARRVDTPSKAALDKRLHAGAKVDRLALTAGPTDARAAALGGRIGLRLVSEPFSVAPAQSGSSALGVYAGPISAAFAGAEPLTASMGIPELVIYYYGGPCAWCMFQPIAHLLKSYLDLLHFVVRDWAVSIILLVLTIRVLLHPITRLSQRRMARFGKKMAELAPKQAKLKERFGDDQVKLGEEMRKLMTESGVNYQDAAVGCFPGFLQTPIWIALSAMIAFNFELRHAPAFFGLFQYLGSLMGFEWRFLADLSDQDRFISIPTVTIPIVGWHFDSLNLLPVILGCVFYMQQKYLSPPQANLTPEQEQQQKITKIMMVVMFPFFMYTSPAALTLYFMVSSTIATLESKHIRAGVDREDEARKARGEEDPAIVRARARALKAGKPDPDAKPGFFTRFRDMIEQAQKLKAEQEKAKGKSRTR